MKKALVFIAMVAMLSGCAAFNKMVTNNELISQLAVEAATARVIYEHPEWKSTTISITDKTIKVIDRDFTISIGDIEAFVRDQVQWNKMTPEEQALVSTLISQVRLDLESSFRAHGVVNPANQSVVVKQVLQWINETARRAA